MHLALDAFSQRTKDKEKNEENLKRHDLPLCFALLSVVCAFWLFWGQSGTELGENEIALGCERDIVHCIYIDK